MHHLRQLWLRVTSGLWFIPLAVVAGGIGMALLLTLADVAAGTDWTDGFPPLFGVGAEGARGLLSAIAGSMMTVASLTFSLTIATLATASAQYTSRVIRNFMRDRVNQFVLGYFVGLFAYCLVVLRSVRAGDAQGFVPPLAVLGGVVLALLSIPTLIYFIHHIAQSIQAGTILENVTRETLRAIDAAFPCGPRDGAIPPLPRPPEGGHWRPVRAGRFGYVQSIDTGAILAAAREHDTVVRLCGDMGAFVTPDGALCEVAGPLDRGLRERLAGAFELGPARTIEQDPAFGVRQIVDIALRALSPGINDTTTAVMCVDHLGVVLEALAPAPIPDRLRAPDGVVRVITPRRSFESLLSLCFDQVRQAGAGNPAIVVSILGALSAAGRAVRDPRRRAALEREAELIGAHARALVRFEADGAPLQARVSAVLAELRVEPAVSPSAG